jgi:hypothetical protein
MPTRAHGLVLLVSALAAIACGADSSLRSGPGKGEAPVASSAAAAPGDVTAIVTRLDALLEREWGEKKPAPVVDDAAYLRRSYLDLWGTIPAAAEVRVFVADTRPDKREQLVARLVADDRHARHMAGYWDEVLMPGGRARLVDRAAFRYWLYTRLKSAVGYDQLVRELVTAEGVNSAGGRPDPRTWELDEAAAPPAEVNGAVNWLLKSAKQPQDLAGSAAKVFLGVNIQCAECHDHPNERWKQEDFRRFTAAFMRVEGRPVGGAGMGIRRFEIEDAGEATRAMRRRMDRTGYDDREPRALDGTALESPEGPRAALAAWLTAKDNPWFSRALVNRMWGLFLGRAFVEPIDELGTAKAVAAAPVLDALTEDFVAHGFDLRRLVRVICASAAYQRASKGGEAGSWRRFAMRPLGADALLDAVVQATGVESMLEELAGDRLPALRMRLRRDFRFAFDVDEEGETDSFSGTVPQALMLSNGAVVHGGASAGDTTTLGRALAAGLTGDALLDELFLATLTRLPSAAERRFFAAQVARGAQADGEPPPAAEAGARGRGKRAGLGRFEQRLTRRARSSSDPTTLAYEDVLWALVNSSEFYFVH